MLLAALALTVTAPSPAPAQGLFESLFGGFRRAAPQPMPPQVNSFADPFGFFSRRRPDGDERDVASGGGGGGGGNAFCVRTCDGRFFPLQRGSSASSAELCKSFCPASKTMVFSGSKIDYAVASNGTRYADLDNAFVYRERVVDGCTCNGKDAFGLARLDLNSDPTLRPGDIVATNQGLASYQGKRSSKSAQFTPISTSSGEWAKRLSQIKVVPASEPEKVKPVADNETTGTTRNDRRKNRSVQLDR